MLCHSRRLAADSSRQPLRLARRKASSLGDVWLSDLRAVNRQPTTIEDRRRQ